jgi:hypothetical protein
MTVAAHYNARLFSKVLNQAVAAFRCARALKFAAEKNFAVAEMQTFSYAQLSTN